MIMKKLILLSLLAISAIHIAAQPNPVHWAFSATPLEGGIYELHFTAKIDGNWNLYSQFIEEGGPVPTSFTYSDLENFTLEGKCKENGNKKEGFDSMFDMDVIKFGKKVDFVQVIKLKNQLPAIKGSVEFMVCNDETCLPPRSVNFSIDLN